MNELNMFKYYMQSKQPVQPDSHIQHLMNHYSDTARRITTKINSRHRSPKQIRRLFSKLMEQSLTTVSLYSLLFIPTAAKIYHLEKMCSSTPHAAFKIKAVLRSATARLSDIR